MEIFIIISQIFLYICFSILTGTFLLSLVPNEYKPDIKIPNYLLQICAIAIPIAAFIPVLDSINFLAPRLGAFEATKLVLTTYTSGTAWDFTLAGSILLILLIKFTKSKEKTIFSLLATTLTIGLIFTISWSSHAGSLDPQIGIISDFLHLLSVSVWVGILLVIGWFSINHHNWLKFLSWFSIVAFSCLSAVALSGLFMMDTIVDGYINSWMISYGQGLLFKHLFLIPLVICALINGLYVKYKLHKNSHFNPKPWVRLESIILLLIFMITSIFSQQEPPHGNYLTEDAVSPLFRLFNDQSIDVSSTIGFVVNSTTVMFFFLSILFFGLIVTSIYKKASIIISFLLSCFFVICIYSMLMVTIVIR